MYCHSERMIVSLAAKNTVYHYDRQYIGPLLALRPSAHNKGAIEALLSRRRRQECCRTCGRVDTVDQRRRPGGRGTIGPPMVADSAP